MSMRAPLMSLALAAGAALASLPAVALDLNGRLAWAQRVALGTPVSGVVTKVEVTPGQSVAAGSTLLTLDERGFRADVSGARAAVARARALADEAVREDERAQELYDRTLLSDHERQVAQIARVEAESAAAQAKAQLARARLDLEHARLSAPFAARVLAVNAVPGQAVVAELQSQPLVVVADSRAMLVEADIAASQLTGIVIGQRVQVGIGGDWLEGKVHDIGLEPLRHDEREVYYRLRALFPLTGQGGLRAGMPAVIRLGAQ